ncbi:MAG: hypothetical protein Q8P95_04005 [bacterium]|nr:hypothetical protein [bacterium]
MGVQEVHVDTDVCDLRRGEGRDQYIGALGGHEFREMGARVRAAQLAGRVYEGLFQSGAAVPDDLFRIGMDRERETRLRIGNVRDWVTRNAARVFTQEYGFRQGDAKEFAQGSPSGLFRNWFVQALVSIMNEKVYWKDQDPGVPRTPTEIKAVNTMNEAIQTLIEDNIPDKSWSEVMRFQLMCALANWGKDLGEMENPSLLDKGLRLFSRFITKKDEHNGLSREREVSGSPLAVAWHWLRYGGKDLIHQMHWEGQQKKLAQREGRNLTIMTDRWGVAALVHRFVKPFSIGRSVEDALNGHQLSRYARAGMDIDGAPEVEKAGDGGVLRQNIEFVEGTLDADFAGEKKLVSCKLTGLGLTPNPERKAAVKWVVKELALRAIRNVKSLCIDMERYLFFHATMEIYWEVLEELGAEGHLVGMTEAPIRIVQQSVLKNSLEHTRQFASRAKRFKEAYGVNLVVRWVKGAHYPEDADDVATGALRAARGNGFLTKTWWGRPITDEDLNCPDADKQGAQENYRRGLALWHACDAVVVHEGTHNPDTIADKIRQALTDGISLSEIVHQSLVGVQDDVKIVVLRILGLKEIPYGPLGPDAELAPYGSRRISEVDPRKRFPTMRWQANETGGPQLVEVKRVRSKKSFSENRRLRRQIAKGWKQPQPV